MRIPKIVAFKGNGRSRTLKLPPPAPANDSPVSVWIHFRNKQRDYPKTVEGDRIVFKRHLPKGARVTVLYEYEGDY